MAAIVRENTMRKAVDWERENVIEKNECQLDRPIEVQAYTFYES